MNYEQLTERLIELFQEVKDNPEEVDASIMLSSWIGSRYSQDESELALVVANYVADILLPRANENNQARNN